MEFLTRLNPTDGHIIAGVMLDEHRFIGRVRITQLFQIAPDPRDSEDKRKLASVKELQDLLSIRVDVQRSFDDAKAKNVGSYSDYVIGISSGHDGITPPIILYSELPLEYATEEKWGFGSILVPWEQKLIAIDGETQLAARYEAANRNTNTKDGYVAVYICHGHTKTWARHAFYDLNVLGIRPNTAVSIGMDDRDPLTAIARQVENAVPFLRGRVNKNRRQLRRSDAELFTIGAMRGACITFAEGIGGVRHGARPVMLAENKKEATFQGAIAWFQAVVDAIGPAIEDREHKLASSPSVLAAIGAMGHAVLNLETEEQQRTARTAQIEKLMGVNWSRGKHWEGIAGKFTPTGTFSIGGSKETAYAIYSALNDETSQAFKQVRSSLRAAA